MSPTPSNTPEIAAGGTLAAPFVLLDAAFGASTAGAALADAAGLIRWTNPMLRELATSAGLDGLVGRRLADLLAPSADPQVLSTGPGCDRHFRHIETPVDGQHALGPAGTVLHLLIECTLEVRRERERGQREIYLSHAADDSMDAILSLDTEGRIRYWNRGAERMFGYTSAQVCGRPYDLLVPEELKTEGELERIADILVHQGALRDFETIRLARGGRPLPVDITVTQLRDENGAVLGRAVIYRDISLRRKLEAELHENVARLEGFKTELSRKVDELRAANLKLRRNQERLIATEKLSAIGEMAAKVAHEIRTPLVTIGGFSHTLWKSMPEDAPQRQYLEIIREEVRRLERIVSEILEYVKPVRIETRPCDVNTMVEEALRTHGRQIDEDGIVLDRRMAADLPPVHVDKYQIHQVLTNLILNAIQALEHVPRDGRRLTVITERGENHVKISIADTGVGIPERHRERVFRSFFTTKPGGSGLGLAISAQLVAQHQATLTFESVEGTGTTFHLCLPTALPHHREVGAST